MSSAIIPREEALAAAAEVYLDAKIRIETEKALAAVGVQERAA